jgi:hypothetical protein
MSFFRGDKRSVGSYHGNPDPGAIFRGHEEPHTAYLSQAGISGNKGADDFIVSVYMCPGIVS